MGFIYADAKRRRMRHVMWAWLALVPYFIGVILYFILRDPLPTPCHQLRHGGTAGFRLLSGLRRLDPPDLLPVRQVAAAGVVQLPSLRKSRRPNRVIMQAESTFIMRSPKRFRQEVPV